MRYVARFRVPIADRLERNSIPEPNSGCLLWLGVLAGGGYGRMKIGGRFFCAHRMAWAEKNGPIPAGMFICHKCDVRSCIEATHLFLGTHQDNMTDKKQKGRAIGFKGEKHPHARLTEQQVREIRSDTRTGSVLGAIYGISSVSINRIRSGENWAHIPRPALP